jgi:hypothetical protein
MNSEVDSGTIAHRFATLHMSGHPGHLTSQVEVLSGAAYASCDGCGWRADVSLEGTVTPRGDEQRGEPPA